MNNTENVQNIGELNSRISVYSAKGYNVIYKDNYGVTLTKRSIDWFVLIVLLFLFWPGAILYIILHSTGNVGKKKSVFLKITNHSNQNSNISPPLRKNLEEIPMLDEEANLKSESLSIDFSESTSSLKIYEKQIHELKSLYQIKEKIACELIEKRFSPPQLTYDRFIGTIDSCSIIFYNQVESTLNLIEVATGHTPNFDEELKKRLGTLKSLVEKIDELTNELAINLSNYDEQSPDEVKYLLEDMEKLVDSIKEYS